MTHEETARQWIKDNPGTFAMMATYASQAKAAGHSRLGIAMVWERTRWFGLVEKRSTEYKLNNNHRAEVARQLMAHYPELAGLFEIRQTAGEIHP